jgi:hypothetical protein
MVEDGASPRQVATWVSKDPEGVEFFHSQLPRFFAWLDGVWDSATDVAHVHAEDIRGLKSVFGGEIFPTGRRNIASSCGVYVDTIILPDPFIRSRLFLEGSDRETAVYWLIKGAMSLLQYKELAVADIETPIVAVVPDLIHSDEAQQDFVFREADENVLAHLEHLFGRKFESLLEAEEFLSHFGTPAEVIGAIKNRDRFLFDTEDDRPLDEQLLSYIDSIPVEFQPVEPGVAVLRSATGRMRQATDLLFRSERLHGSPLIDAPTSWKYFNWKLEYGSTKLGRDDVVALHVTKGLQSAAAGDMAWLGSVPPAALIEMRKVGALPELRSMLSEGIAELVEAKPENFFRTGDRVVDNIQRAFDQHSEKLAELKGRKWRFVGVELASCVVHGAIEVASACGVPLVSLVNSAMDQAMDVPKLKELPGKIQAFRKDERSLKKSAVGLLFQQRR